MWLRISPNIIVCVFIFLHSVFFCFLRVTFWMRKNFHFIIPLNKKSIFFCRPVRWDEREYKKSKKLDIGRLTCYVRMIILVTPYILHFICWSNTSKAEQQKHRRGPRRKESFFLFSFLWVVNSGVESIERNLRIPKISFFSPTTHTYSRHEKFIAINDS